LKKIQNRQLIKRDEQCQEIYVGVGHMIIILKASCAQQGVFNYGI
jgi:hypothetical protein